MEHAAVLHTPDGPRSDGMFGIIDRVLPLTSGGLRLVGAYRRGAANARAIRHTALTLTFAGLPAAFDGYRILHLTDFHFPPPGGSFDALMSAVDGTVCDLCVLTGDFLSRRSRTTSDAIFLDPMRDLMARVRVRDGYLSVLGNHDAAAMVESLETLGIRVLTNECVPLERDGSRIDIVGLDDVSWFFTPGAQHVLETLPRPRPFTILLVHSPEFAAEAATAGCALYLCGHTHGGQICLPGGFPLIRRIHRNRRLFRGLWTCGSMIGYTNSGVGVSGILPLRFNCPPEVTRIVLRRGP